MSKKKTYRKPEIRQVKLVPEEAVLSGCKLGNPGGNRASRCNSNQGGCTASGAGS